MAAKSMVRLDKIGAKNHIVNFTFASALQNGRIVALGALKTDGEGYAAAAPADITTDRMVLHASVWLDYLENTFEEDFELPVGAFGRGYVLEVGDIITLTDDCFSDTTVLNQFAIPANGATTLAPSATYPVDTFVTDAVVLASKLIFKVIEKGTLGVNGTACTTVEVVKA